MSRLIPSTTSIDNGLLKPIYGHQRPKHNNDTPFTVIDGEPALSELIDALVVLPVEPPSIYVDLEGIHVSRQGTISILQLYILPRNHAYLVDVYQLQNKTFTTTGNDSNQSLKTILETKDIPKVFFDVRNDSDALFYHFQVRLSGVEDIQLMELATRRPRPGKCVKSLQRCIRNDVQMTVAEKTSSLAARKAGKRLFAPEQGGRYEAFNDRPLAEEIIRYCIQNVEVLPRLWYHYQGKITSHWAMKVQKATEERVLLPQCEDYNGHGKHKALAPAGWYFPNYIPTYLLWEYLG